MGMLWGRKKKPSNAEAARAHALNHTTLYTYPALYLLSLCCVRAQHSIEGETYETGLTYRRSLCAPRLDGRGHHRFGTVYPPITEEPERGSGSPYALYYHDYDYHDHIVGIIRIYDREVGRQYVILTPPKVLSPHTTYDLTSTGGSGTHVVDQVTTDDAGGIWCAADSITISDEDLLIARFVLTEHASHK